MKNLFIPLLGLLATVMCVESSFSQITEPELKTRILGQWAISEGSIGIRARFHKDGKFSIEKFNINNPSVNLEVREKGTFKIKDESTILIKLQGEFNGLTLYQDLEMKVTIESVLFPDSKNYEILYLGNYPDLPFRRVADKNNTGLDYWKSSEKK